ncbi:hypothetical protein QA641_14035 [Bradyrhizobium sp. CB1650]|uniref:hypothetical protein n=1 Tax=Bradyrhizobium sp. CB1650 TaxID=3039153 RepID=UPI00243589A3|nr:hypothetical protein [Bradyrhizobium sp. CB1650]WGD54929.1 hypothetical protein QA641_14035 [Bradyrhizobium sp. CB1650]
MAARHTAPAETRAEPSVAALLYVDEPPSETIGLPCYYAKAVHSRIAMSLSVLTTVF